VGILRDETRTPALDNSYIVADILNVMNCVSQGDDAVCVGGYKFEWASAAFPVSETSTVEQRTRSVYTPLYDERPLRGYKSSIVVLC